MIERTIAISNSSSPGGNTPWMDTTTSGEEHTLQENSLLLIEPSTSITRTYGTTANASVNPTIACRFMAIQRIDNYEKYLLGVEDTSGLSVSFASSFDLSFLEESTKAHIHTCYRLSGLFCGNLEYPEEQFRSGLIALLEHPRTSTQVIQEEEERETIYADTNQVLTFRDLANALDRISRPTEVEDIPLPFDPDDYPVV